MTFLLLLLAINKISKAQRIGDIKRLKWKIKQWDLTWVRSSAQRELVVAKLLYGRRLNLKSTKTTFKYKDRADSYQEAGEKSSLATEHLPQVLTTG